MCRCRRKQTLQDLQVTRFGQRAPVLDGHIGPGRGDGVLSAPRPCLVQKGNRCVSERSDVLLRLSAGLDAKERQPSQRTGIVERGNCLDQVQNVLTAPFAFIL